MLYFVCCRISMSYYLTLFLIIRCGPLRNMSSTFDATSSWIFSALPRHIYIFCALMYPLIIAYGICIKVPWTLNLKIMSVQMFLFIFISVLLSPHKIICLPAAPPISLYDVISRFRLLCLFRLNESFSVIIRGNPMKLLQYVAIINTSIWHKYNANFFSISVSLINIFIVILYYKL